MRRGSTAFSIGHGCCPTMSPRISRTTWRNDCSGMTWSGDQIMGLEEPINRGLRDKIAFGVGEAHGQFPRRQRRLVQRQVDDALTDIVGDAVPDAVRPGMSVVQSFWPTGPIQVVPTVEGGTRNANLFQGTPYRQGGLLDQPNDLKLLSGGVPHVASSPSEEHT